MSRNGSALQNFISSSRKLPVMESNNYKSNGTTRANHNPGSIFLRKDCILSWESQVLTRSGDLSKLYVVFFPLCNGGNNIPR